MDKKDNAFLKTMILTNTNTDIVYFKSRKRIVTPTEPFIGNGLDRYTYINFFGHSYFLGVN